MYAVKCEYCGKAFNAEKDVNCPHCGAGLSDDTLGKMRVDKAAKERQEFERQKQRLREMNSPQPKRRVRPKNHTFATILMIIIFGVAVVAMVYILFLYKYMMDTTMIFG